jgi:hypothetical protein
VSSHYLAGLAYRYVASRRAQLVLPIYNVIDSAVFGLPAMERLPPSCSPPGRRAEMRGELIFALVMPALIGGTCPGCRAARSGAPLIRDRHGPERSTHAANHHEVRWCSYVSLNSENQ